MSVRFGIVLTFLLTVAAVGRGDEAVRRDGTRVAGRLALSDTRRLVFHVAGRTEPIDAIERVRFAPGPPAGPAVPLGHQVCLEHGEVLHAAIHKLDPDHLHVRTAWTANLAIPRTRIERVRNLPGWHPVIVHAFADGLAGWKATGEPRIADGRLVFDRDGQAVGTTLVPPRYAARLSVGFQAGRHSHRQVWLELGFARDGTPAPLRVELVGPGERYQVESPTPSRHDGRVRREPGPHRVAVEFDPDRLHVFLGDRVVWSQAGPGELRSVRLVGTGTGEEAAGVDDVAVYRPHPVDRPRPWADLTADAIHSADGDESYGSLTAAGPSGLTLEVRGQKRQVAWADVAEFTFRRGPVPVRATTGEHVRLRVRGLDGQRDILDGVVRALDERALVLDHATLGELTIPRDRLEEIRLRFHGRRVPVDATPRHLGARSAFGFAAPKPEGLGFARRFPVAAPAGGFVVVEAARVAGNGTPVEVCLNGMVLGELNRQADRADAAVREFRVPLPATRAADIGIEVRLRPQPDRRVTGVDLRAVWLELPEAR